MAKNDVYDSTGNLIVRTVTAGGALPLAGANVTIMGADPQNQDVHLHFLTDQSGNTTKIPLKAPEASLSQSPGRVVPYATYHLIAEKEDYFIHEALKVPVFAGITAVQTLEMIPKGYRNGYSNIPQIVRPIEETEPFQGEGGR